MITIKDCLCSPRERFLVKLLNIPVIYLYIHPTYNQSLFGLISGALGRLLIRGDARFIIIDKKLAYFRTRYLV